MLAPCCALRMDLNKQWQASQRAAARECMERPAGRSRQPNHACRHQLCEHARIDETRMMLMFCQRTAGVVLQGLRALFPRTYISLEKTESKLIIQSIFHPTGTMVSFLSLIHSLLILFIKFLSSCVEVGYKVTTHFSSLSSLLHLSIKSAYSLP
jgi:hypothetical protein